MSDDDVVYMYEPGYGLLHGRFDEKPSSGMIEVPRNVAELFCALYEKILECPDVQIYDHPQRRSYWDYRRERSARQ